MDRLATVLLRHETAGGDHHYDWMLERPGGGCDAGLWTARTGCPSWCWLAAQSWDLTLLADHRRAYLTYEGPLGGGRGHVRRVDAGHFTPRRWASDRIVLDLEMGHCRGWIELGRVDADRWQATLE